MKRIFIFALYLLFFLSVNAQRPGSIVRIDGSISVACINRYMDYCHHSQVKDNWCWAACVQMVLDYNGIEVSQSRIVERTYGDYYDITANKADIVRSINGWKIGGYYVRAYYEQYKNARTLIEALTRGVPLIIGLDEQYSSTGHAYILSHIFFTYDNYGNMVPRKAIVINPANSGDLEESLEWSDFYRRINTIITINISSI